MTDLACITPRCSDCTLPLTVFEPFPNGVWHQLRCPGCGSFLKVRRIREHGHDAWLIRSLSPVVPPLQSVASPKLRHRFLDACRRVAGLLRPCEGVEPGFASLLEQDMRTAQTVEAQGGKVKASAGVAHGEGSEVGSSQPPLPDERATTGNCVAVAS